MNESVVNHIDKTWSDAKGWAVAVCAAIALLVTLISAASFNAYHKRYTISAAISQGVDPIKAVCAIDPPSDNQVALAMICKEISSK